MSEQLNHDLACPPDLLTEINRVVAALAAHINGHESALGNPLPRMAMTGIQIQRRDNRMQVMIVAGPEVV